MHLTCIAMTMKLAQVAPGPCKDLGAHLKSTVRPVFLFSRPVLCPALWLLVCYCTMDLDWQTYPFNGILLSGQSSLVFFFFLPHLFLLLPEHKTLPSFFLPLHSILGSFTCLWQATPAHSEEHSCSVQCVPCPTLVCPALPWCALPCPNLVCPAMPYPGVPCHP